MKILTTAFIALVFWIAWGVASVKFGAANALSSPSNTAGQEALLAGTFIPATLLTVATIVKLVRLPFKARKRKRAARDQSVLK